MDPKKNEGSSSSSSSFSSSSSSASKALNAQSSLDSNKIGSSPSMSLSSSACVQCNTSLGYRIISDDQSRKICAPPCHSAYFSDENSKSTINTWLGILSVSCCLSCTFVLLTFCIDITRFKYPQRPIIFLALCYFFVSCGYLIRLTLGHENVACRFESEVSQL